MKTVIAGLEEGLNAIADALEGGGGGSDIVPTPTAQDEGKVLTANNNGTASWENSQGGLPTIGGSLDVLATGYDESTHSYFPYWESSLSNIIGHNGSNGDVLTLDDGDLVFLPPQGGGGVPDYSEADQGSVLNKQYNGELGWDRPENLLPEGSLLPEISGNDDGKVLQAVYSDKSGSYAHWVTPSGGGGGLGSTTFTINGSDFTQQGTGYQAVFDSNDSYTGDMQYVISTRIYSSSTCSIPCSIQYIDKTGWAVNITADDYAIISRISGLTLKIFAQN